MLVVHLLQDCARNGIRGRIGLALRQYLESYLPPDAYQLCDGNTFLAVTKGGASSGYIRPPAVTTCNALLRLLN
jgi:hypothetical protein